MIKEKLVYLPLIFFVILSACNTLSNGINLNSSAPAPLEASNRKETAAEFSSDSELDYPRPSRPLGNHSGGIFYVVKDGNAGLIDADGNEIVSCVYDRVYEFSDGRAIIVVGCDPDTKYGFVDTFGNVIAPLIYDVVEPFKDGFAAVCKDDKWGFIDTTGKEITPCIYNDVRSFNEGFSRVRKGQGHYDGEYGFIDATGNEVIPCIYDNATDFKEGYSIVSKNVRGDGIIDINGNEVVPLNHDYYYEPFSDGIAQIYCGYGDPGKQRGFIDTTGSVVAHPSYVYAGSFSEGMAWVGIGADMHNCLYGFIDSADNVVIPPLYTVAAPFSEGLAGVAVLGEPFSNGSRPNIWGFIDRDGNEIVPFSYNAVGSFSEGMAWVRIGERGWGMTSREIGFVDAAGNEIIPPIYDFDDSVGWYYENIQIGNTYTFSNGFARVMKNWKYGYIDKIGYEIIPPIFDDARYFSNGLAVLQKDASIAKFEIINVNGSIIQISL